MKKENEFKKDFKNKDIRARWLEILKISKNDGIVSEALKDIDFSEFVSVEELNSCVDSIYNDFLKDEEERQKAIYDSEE